MHRQQAEGHGDPIQLRVVSRQQDREGRHQLEAGRPDIDLAIENPNDQRIENRQNKYSADVKAVRPGQAKAVGNGLDVIEEW